MTWLPNGGKPQGGYSYDAESAAIQRKRKLAEALMQAQGPQGTQFAGGMAVKQGPLEFLAPMIQQQLGAKMGRDTTAAEGDLQTKRNSQLGEWLQKMPGEDPLQPVMPSTGFSTPERQAGFQEAQTASADVDRNRKLAWALQGGELGQMGQAVGGRALEQQLFPRAPEQFTLKPGEQRMDDRGRTIAALPAAATSEKSPFGSVNPSEFTPESLAKFAQSKNYADLVPVPPKADKPAAQFVSLTPAEIVAAGLPAGTAAQRNVQTGEVNVISKRDNTGVLSQKDATTAKMKLNTVQLARQQLNAIKESFDTGRQGVNAFGPGQGMLPTEAGKLFDSRVDQMRSTLTALTRVPGVGAMSDYETKLDQGKFPDRGDWESVTGDKLTQLENMLALIENGYNDLLSGGNTSKPPSESPQAAAGGGGPANIQSDADYDALPSGAEFVGPDGVRRRKP